FTPSPTSNSASWFRVTQSPITRMREENAGGISPSAVGPTLTRKLPPLEVTSANVAANSPADLYARSRGFHAHVSLMVMHVSQGRDRRSTGTYCSGVL